MARWRNRVTNFTLSRRFPPAVRYGESLTQHPAPWSRCKHAHPRARFFFPARDARETQINKLFGVDESPNVKRVRDKRGHLMNTCRTIGDVSARLYSDTSADPSCMNFPKETRIREAWCYLSSLLSLVISIRRLLKRLPSADRDSITTYVSSICETASFSGLRRVA